MKIQVTISDETVQSYLDNYNEVKGTNLKVETLTAKQVAKIEEAFADLASGEIDMRCDDHAGFETETYFDKL